MASSSKSYSAPKPHPNGKARFLGIPAAMGAGLFGASMLAAWWAGTYMRYEVTSLGLLFLCCISTVAVLFLAAYFFTVLVTRLLLGGGPSPHSSSGGGGTAPHISSGRGGTDGPQVHSGRDAGIASDLRVGKAMLRPDNLIRSGILLIFLVASFLAADRVAKGAFSDMQALMLDTLGRSENPEDVCAFLDSVADMLTRDDLNRYSARLPAYLADQREPVRTCALGTVAVLACRMNVSVTMLSQRDVAANAIWEFRELNDLRELTGDAVRKGLPSFPAAQALACLGDAADLPLFSAMLKPANTDEEIAGQAALGLAAVGSLDAANILVGSLPARIGDSRATILWAIASIGRGLGSEPNDDALAQQVLEVISPLLDSLDTARLPSDPASLCGIAAAVAAFEHAGATARLTALFDSAAGETMCPRIEQKFLVGPPQALVTEQELRLLLLNALSDVGENNREMHAWVRRTDLRTDLSPKVANAVRTLAQRLPK